MKKYLQNTIPVIIAILMAVGCNPQNTQTEPAPSTQETVGDTTVVAKNSANQNIGSSVVIAKLAGKPADQFVSSKHVYATVTDTISSDNVMLLIDSGAVSRDVEISIVSTMEEYSGEIPPNLENLTVGGIVYRMLPDGQKFEKDITIAMRYDSTALPYGYTPNDIYTFFYDERARMWQQVERDSVDTQNQIVYSRTNHFTDYINGVLKVPENSDAMAYTPTTIKDLKAADPMEGVTMISPPQANNMGTANLMYPLNIPAGRRGMHPQLAITYNSAGGSGILGLGWNLPISEISVDTRRGVPLYSPDEETETYTLDGDVLVTSYDNNGHLCLNEPAYRRRWQQRDTTTNMVQFYPRIEGLFRRIQRINTSPKTYYWIITEKNGTKYYYGDTSITRLTDNEGNIFRWCLSRVEDTYGNTITYHWNQRTFTLPGLNPGKQLLLQEINYTGKDSLSGRYNIRFYYSDTKKYDASISARGGFLEADGFLLDHIDVCFDTSLIRSYYMGYKIGAFGKTLLCNIVEANPLTVNDEGEDCYSSPSFLPAQNPDWIDPQSASLANVICDIIDCRYAQYELEDEEDEYARTYRVSENISKTIFENDVYDRCAQLKGGKYYTFNEHRFDYSEVPSNMLGDSICIINGSANFDEVEGPLFLVKGSPGSLEGTGTKSWNVGGGLDVGFGHITFLKNITLGGNYTYSKNNTEGLLTLVDLNGDGLVDKLYNSNNGIRYRLRDVNNVKQFGPEKAIEGLGNFLVSTGSNNIWGVEGCVGSQNGVRFGANWVNGNTSVTTYLSDIDGDGLPDLVRNGTIYYNRIRNNPNRVFVDAQYEFGLLDTIYDCGSIRIDTVFKGEPVIENFFDDYEADTIQIIVCHDYVYETADNIMRDTVECHDSTIVNFYHAPKPYEPNLENVRLWVAPYDGVIEINGEVSMASPRVNGDGVRIIIQHDTAIRSNLTWGMSTPMPTAPLPDTVKKGDKLFFRVLSEGSRVSDRVIWNPTIRYRSVSDSAIDIHDSITSDGLNRFVYSYKDDFILSGIQHVMIPYKSHVRLISRIEIDSTKILTDSIKYQILINGGVDTTITVSNTKRYDSSVKDTILEKGSIVQIRMQGYHGRVNWGAVEAQCRLSIVKNHSTISSDTSIVCIDTLSCPGDTLYFYDIYPQIQKQFSSDYDSSYAIFGPMYRNWGQFAYKSPDNSLRLDTSLLHLDSIYNLQQDSSQYTSISNTDTVSIDGLGAEASVSIGNQVAYNPLASAFFIMQPDFKHNCWSAYSDYAYIGRDTLSNLPHPADGMSIEESDEIVAASISPIMSDEASVVTRENKNYSWGVCATGHLEIKNIFNLSLEASYTESESRQVSDMLDLNGDGYPDVLSETQVQYTTPQGGLSLLVGKHCIDGYHLDSTMDQTVGGSFCGSAIFSKPLTASSPRKASTSLSITPGANLSGSVTDGTSIVSWVDINGDGLPDKVVNKNGHLYYYQNLGYGFMGKRCFASGDVRRSFGWGNSGGASLTGVLESIWLNEDGHAFLHTADSLGQIIAQDSSLIGGVLDSVRLALLRKLEDISFNNRLNVSLTAGMNTSVSKNNNTLSYLDLNGDGLPDQVEKYPNGYIVRFNTGNNFSGGMAVLHVDADSDNISLSTDLSAALTAGITIGIIPLKIEVNPKGGLSRSLSYTRAQWMDINGDGIPDYVWSAGDGIVAARCSNLGTANRLVKITLPTKGTYGIAYSLNEDGESSNMRHYVMSEITIRDNLFDSLSQHQVFRYRDRYYDRKEREDYGYAEVVSIEDETLSGQTDYRRTVRHFLNKDYLFHGLCDSIKVIHADTIFAQEYYHYNLMEIENGDVIGTGPGCHGDGWPAVEYQKKYYYDNNQLKITTHQSFYYEQFGNISLVKDSGDLADPNDDYNAGISYDYYVNDDDYLVSSVVLESVQGFPSGRIRTATYNTEGDIKTLNFVINSNDTATYDFRYDIYGNLDTIYYPQNRDGQRFFVTYKYDTVIHTLPVKTTNAYGLTSEALYSFLSQKPLWTVSVNGARTNYFYDVQGRLTELYAPFELNSGYPTIRYEYYDKYRHDREFWDTCAYWARTYNLNYNAQYIKTISLVDGLGRPRVVKKDAVVNDVPMRVVGGWSMFDGLGRKIKDYYPSVEDLSTADSLMTNNFSANYNTAYSYDPLDRITKTVYPDGTHSTNKYSIDNDADGYLRLKILSSDQNGHGTQVFNNVRGQSTTIINPLGATTRFRYDNLGQLTKTISPDGDSTRHMYDMLGRRTDRYHPAAGHTHWDYDRAGNMYRQKQNNGECIAYEYEYTRPTRIIYPNRPWNNVWYQYGNTGTEAGRVIAQQDATGVQEFKYDDMGNVTLNRHTYVQPHTPDLLTLSTQWSYDSWGRVQSIVYPDNEIVEYNYDSGGLLHDIHGYKNGIVGHTTYIKELLYDCFGQRIFMQGGDSVQTFYTYDSASRRLVHLKDSLPATQETLQNIAYKYDDVGNIVSIHDFGRNPREQFYKYDDADQLIHSNGEMPQIYVQGQVFDYETRYTYTRGGKMRSKYVESDRFSTTRGLYPVNYNNAYTYENPHNPYAVTRIYGSSGFECLFYWNENGNLAESCILPSISRRRLCWTEDNRLQAFMETTPEGSVAAYYNYTADGERNFKLTSPPIMINQNGSGFEQPLLVLPTLYASPLITLTQHGYTKHYFEEGRRICSKIGGGFINVHPNEINNHVQELNHNTYEWQYQSQLNGIRYTFGHCIHSEPNVIPTESLRRMLFEQELSQDRGEPAFYYHSDHLGSTAYLVVNGHVAQVLNYLPFGEDWLESNNFNPDDTTRLGIYRFNGKEKDYESGFHYYGARYYWSELLTGWLSVDPMADKYPGISPYAYCAWNPVKLIDPNGMDTLVFSHNGYYEKKLTGGDNIGVIRGKDDEYATKFEFADERWCDRFVACSDDDIAIENVGKGRDNMMYNKIIYANDQKIEALLEKIDFGKLQSQSLSDRIDYAKRQSRGGTLDFVNYNDVQKISPYALILTKSRGSYMAHDKFNFGNFLWGMAMGRLKMPRLLVLAGSHWDCYKNTKRFDSLDDQRSIWFGYNKARK